jgi:quinol monooxygenase YgiN
MIYVIATVELKPGRRDLFLAEFRKIVPMVLEEEGCIAYGPTIDLETGLPAQPPVRDDVATIVEAWESLDHLMRHLAASHMHGYRDRIKELVVRTTLSVLTPAF